MRHFNTHPLFPMIECLRGMVCAFVMLLLVQTFLVKGMLTPHFVSSCSMSSAMRGPHVELRCPECETAFCIETGHEPPMSATETPLRWGTCPACAFAQVPVLNDSIRRGDRLFVNRAVVGTQTIRRWDVVLFRRPDDGTLTVKRVVGLPGERLTLRDGDVYLDGQIVTKPWAVQQAMRIPVPYGRWEMQVGKNPGQFELAYHPIRNVPHAKSAADTDDEHGSTARSLYGISNQLCENQWRPHSGGNIFSVDDLMLEFDWRPKKTMPISIRHGKEQLCLNLNAAKGTFLVTSEDATFQGRMPHLGTNRPCRVTIGFFDRQLTLAFDGQNVFEQAFETPDANHAAHCKPEHVTSKEVAPFAISLLKGNGLSKTEQEEAVKNQVTNLQLWRDVYYTSTPDDTAAKRESDTRASAITVTIPNDGYYLLGDNSGFSIDSRCWAKPFVTQRDLIGVVSVRRHKNIGQTR